MTHFKKLALAGAVGVLLLGANAANAHVTYNTACGDTCPPDGSSAGPWTEGNPGYTGNLPATWVAIIHNDGGVANSQTANSADAGFSIDMGGRAYKDGSSNWGHTADYGLFALHHDATVTITVTSADANLRPAFGLWSGWDTNGGSSRHAAFLGNGALNAMAAGPLGSSLAVLDANAWAVAPSVGAGVTATLTRSLAAGNYTLIIGGYDSLANPALAYTATISAAASPVPIPAAVWLFGSSVLGLLGLGRRKRSV